MLHLARGCQVDIALLGTVPLLGFHLREERRQLVILLLRPLLIRMVVTASTLDADAEEHLRRRLRQILRLAGDPEVVRRPLLEPAPPGQQQLAGELVPWLVLRHAL